MGAFEITDRYQALGIAYPDRDTMCKGQCEGVGRVPIHWEEVSEPWLTLWQEAHRKCTVWGVIKSLLKNREWWFWKSVIRNPGCDGWHFVKCPDCDGTGKLPPTE